MVCTWWKIPFSIGLNIIDRKYSITGKTLCVSKFVLIDFYCCILYFSQSYTFYLFWTSRPSSCSSNHIKKSTIECYSIRFAIMSRLLLTMKINRIKCFFYQFGHMVLFCYEKSGFLNMLIWVLKIDNCLFKNLFWYIV